MKRLVVTLNCISLAWVAFGQSATSNEKADTTILKNIEVVKEYNPVIKEAGKISTIPELKDIKTEKKALDISVWTTPYAIKPSQIPTLDFATLEAEPQKTYKDRFVSVGVGNYGSVMGELYTPFIKKDKDLLDFHILHNSTFGKIKLTPKLYKDLPSSIKSRATDVDTKAKINYIHSFKNKELSAFVNGGYDFFKYYGYDNQIQNLANEGVSETENDSLKQGITRIGANVRFRTKDFISKWKYDFQVNYQLFGNKNNVHEHTIHSLLNGAYRFDNSSLHLGIDMHNIILGLPESDEEYNFDRGTTLNNYTVIKLLPHYYFSGEIGEITVGVKGAFSINQGKKGIITPDVYGKVRLIKDLLYVYAGVTGDYIVNNYQEISKINKFTSPDVRIADTYIPIDAYVGLTVGIAKRVDLDIHAGYKLIDNPYFFINRQVDSIGIFKNTYDVVYDEKAGLFNAGIKVSYDCNERFKLNFMGDFNKWSLTNLEEAWHQPKWKMNIESMFMATESLRFRLGYLLEAGKYAMVKGNSEKLPNAHDLYLGADYKLFDWFNLFINLDNIANQQYENWFGYTQQGFNIKGGLTIVF